MVRSGHSVVAYGKFMLLFGGIDFAEEVVYNDLYLFELHCFCSQNTNTKQIQIINKIHKIIVFCQISK